MFRGIIRLGNRSVRVSDFSLQKLCFSALCGPNEGASIYDVRTEGGVSTKEDVVREVA